MSFPKELFNYTIKNTEVEVDNFFYFTPAENWTFYDYYLWFAIQDKKMKFSKAIHSYHNNLNKIKETRETVIIKELSDEQTQDDTASDQNDTASYQKDEYRSTDNDIKDNETSILPLKRKLNFNDSDLDWVSLYCFAYHLYSDKSVKPEDYGLYLTESTTLQSSLFNICIENLCGFKKLKKLDLSYLSVFLSGIVNTIDVHNWPIVEECCSNINMENIVRDNLLKNFDKYSDFTLLQLMTDIKKIFIEKGINGLKVFIYEKNLYAYKGNIDSTSSQTLIMLDMLDHIPFAIRLDLINPIYYNFLFQKNHISINMVKYSTWMDESEAGYLEYWKPLFKILFRDNDIYIKSGETSCEASRIDRKINEYEYGISSKNVMGRKIDLIFYINIDNVNRSSYGQELFTIIKKKSIIENNISFGTTTTKQQQYVISTLLPQGQGICHSKDSCLVSIYSKLS
ncbi:hypothetical protein BJ944DRAFT_286303 [Cunninghamella echinulata]|nr:hypothetical protein BJ944DRAFT_286303 [Cunninghamella echinulata]